MNWEKIKFIVIILLVVLNAGLFGLNFEKSKEYKLSEEQQAAIKTVLADREIILKTELVKSFPPMRQLTVNVPVLEASRIKRQFFADDEEVKTTLEFNKTIMRSDKQIVSIENNDITMECPEGTGPIENFSLETAKESVKQYLLQTGIDTKQYSLETILEREQGYEFQYFEEFHNYRIFSSSTRVTVTKKGVTALNIAYYQTETFTGEKIEVCSPDEALLTFLREVERSESPAVIGKMELGYDFQEKSEVAEGNHLKLIPCYHIAVEGREEPYVINAYSNKLIR